MENILARTKLKQLMQQKVEASTLLDNITAEIVRVATEVAETESKTSFDFEGKWLQIRKANGGGKRKLYILSAPPKGRPRGSKNKARVAVSAE